MNKEIATRLAELRKKNGLSQEELADKLGVSRQAVSKWETGESSPDTDNLIALAEIYNVSLDELVKGDNATSKRKGIHIKGEDGEVNIEGINIHVKDDDGSEVHIGDEGIKVVDKSEEIKVNIHQEKGLIETIFSSSLALLIVIAYILIGFLVPDGWRNYWVLFFLIPLVPSLIEAIKRRRFCVFAYPVLVVMLFLSLGMFLNIWHPTWVLFITIPVYYTIFGPVDKAIHQKKKKITVIDNKD